VGEAPVRSKAEDVPAVDPNLDGRIGYSVPAICAASAKGKSTLEAISLCPCERVGSKIPPTWEVLPYEIRPSSR
jgi:hypothetical protein